MSLKLYYTTKYEDLNYYKHLYLGLLIASSDTFTYTYLISLNINNVLRPLLYKYLDEAKIMGSNIMKCVSNNNERVLMYVC